MTLPVRDVVLPDSETRRAPLLVLACTIGVPVLPAAAHEAGQATPPNRDDPCAKNARNVCGTTGVGSYKVGQYGQRLYGDFKGAIAGIAHSYCIDLRFWYPSAAYKYKEDTGGRARQPATVQGVPAERQQRIAYAIARFGQTGDPSLASAVMLYVHTQMGDQRPGELDPADAGPAVPALSRAGRARLRRLPRAVPDRLPADGVVHRRQGRPAPTVRILSATGTPSRTSRSRVAGDGVHAQQQKTSANGTAPDRLHARDDLAAPRASSADGLPSNAPARLRAHDGRCRPERPAPDRRRPSQSVSTTLRTAASKRQIGVTTAASPSVIAIGEAASDKVTISGAEGRLEGDRRRQGLRPLRDARPGVRAAARRSSRRRSRPTARAPTRRRRSSPRTAGWYTFVIVVPSDAVHVGVTTPCGVAAESFKAQAVPQLKTTVSAQRVTVGTPIHRHDPGLRPGRRAGDDQGVPLRAVLDAAGSHLHGTAGLERARSPHPTDGTYVTLGLRPEPARLLHLPRADRRDRPDARRADRLR